MSLIASGSLQCKFENAANPCGFPAAGSEIFFFDDLARWEIAGTQVGINKVTLLVAIAVIVVLGFFLYAFRKPQLVP